MTTGEIISLCALCLSAIVGLFAILTFVRNGSKDVRHENKESVGEAERRGFEKGELNAKLDSISNGISSIRDDMKTIKANVGTLENGFTSLKSRVITLEREMHEVRLKLGIITTEYPGE